MTERLILTAGLVALLGILWSSPLPAAEPPDWLLGDWVLNSEKSQELQPKQRSGGGGGFGSASVSVGGLPVPMPGGGGAPAGSPRDPKVLRCSGMTVAMDEDGGSVHFTYAGSGEAEVMKPGNDQGRRTNWNSRRLTQKYATTSRSVSKTYELTDEDQLLVKVKISPKGSRSATFVRVFDRPPT